MQKLNKKGFTLIELLAVIIILGLLMAIAIPSVTRYIDQSRRNTLANTIGNYINAAVTGMNNQDYNFNAARANYTATSAEVGVYMENTLYAIPIGCIDLEKGGSNPFGAWGNGSYVLVSYTEGKGYTYGFMFRDMANHYMLPTISTGIDAQKIVTGATTDVVEFTGAALPTNLSAAITTAFGAKTAYAVSYCATDEATLFRR